MRGWEKNLLGRPLAQAHLLLPGIFAAVALAWLGIWLSNFIGVNLMGFAKTPVSSVMMAIVLGLIVANVFHLPAWIKPGITFAGNKILRLGIILLGIGLSILDVFKLGALGIPVVLICVACALFFTTRLNTWLKLPARLGTLIAVGTSICGVSAIAATGPAIQAQDEEVAYAIAVITIFGVTATLVYPYLAYVLFGGSAMKAGLFLGTAIHDTSQVTGAALLFSETYHLATALDVATVTKLFRNILMIIVIPAMAFLYARQAPGDTSRKQPELAKLFPLFILAFLALAVVRSMGDASLLSGGRAFGIADDTTWKTVLDVCKTWAPNFLTIALAGIGLSTDLHIIKGMGLKPFFVGLGAGAVVGVVSFVSISLLGI